MELHESGNALVDILYDDFGVGDEVLEDCRFFILPDGTMGLAPGHAEISDVIFVPCGAEAPIVVPQTDTKGRFQVVGECYVNRIMKGELFQGISQSEITTID